ncbi:MAG: YceI family protein [Bacteroidia bacterium]|nr:YceI family protein [Bacteroidia bacterium]
MSTTKWVLDPTHSEIGFKVKHMMFTNVSGHITNFQLHVSTNNDDFLNADIEFIAESSSINTNNEQRNNHIKSSDFFDVENFPVITFQSTSFTKLDEHNNYELTGNLTIKNITKSVAFHVENGGIMKDPMGNIKAGFTITGKINRTDFGMNWNDTLETGGVLVSEVVRINCEIQLVKQTLNS